jgi:hypothetical protein
LAEWNGTFGTGLTVNFVAALTANCSSNSCPERQVSVSRIHDGINVGLLRDVALAYLDLHSAIPATDDGR